MKTRVAQCLCGPQRHAILAMAINDNTVPDLEALAMLRLAVTEFLAGRGEALGLPSYADPWCRLCGAKPEAWQYEIRWSKEFASLDDALASLRRSENDQRASAELLELLDATYNASLLRRSK